MPSIIPARRPHSRPRPQVRSRSVRALVVAAHLERGHEPEAPPGRTDGRPSDGDRIPD